LRVAGALETAHRAGFLHRDIKPANVLFTEFGEPALSDFGVAALQTATQGFAGASGPKLVHAAPELLEANRLSAATDVYGLASTLYEALCGRAPFVAFEGEGAASVILRILRDPPPPLRVDGAPAALSALLERSLAKDPEQRPHSAHAFAQALHEIELSCGWPRSPYVAPGDTPPWTTAGAPRRSWDPVEAPPARERSTAGTSGSVAAAVPAGFVAAGEVAKRPDPLVTFHGVAPAPDPAGRSLLSAVAMPRNVVPPVPLDASRSDRSAPSDVGSAASGSPSPTTIPSPDPDPVAPLTPWVPRPEPASAVSQPAKGPHERGEGALRAPERQGGRAGPRWAPPEGGWPLRSPPPPFRWDSLPTPVAPESLERDARRRWWRRRQGRP
jgi:hypothetical protein